jgi:type II secretory pathway pseudopilin PulG
VVMGSKAMNKYRQGKCGKKDRGFGLLEASIALTTLGITLAYAMPLFLYSKMNNSKSEVRTGAMMVAQRILDTTRGTPFVDIPQTLQTVTYWEQTKPSPPLGSVLADLKAMGKDFTATTYHCEIIAPATVSECDANYKTLRVEVKRNGSSIYEMSAGFTNFR